MILYGKPVAEALQEGLNVQNKPMLATVRVGEDGADIAYETNAGKKLRSLGIEVEHIHLPLTVTQKELEETIHSLNQRKEVDGILLFQPLPSHLSHDLPIDPKKDVDGSGLESKGRLMAGLDCFVAGAPLAVVTLLNHYNIPLEGKKVTIIGRSTVVGTPLALMLIARNATVTVCHSKTKDLAKVARDSDILITSAGRPNLVTPDFVHSEQIVIDVSTNVVDGTLCGDIDPAIHHKVAGYTPTPGGIGAICTSALAQQVCLASQQK